mmetsp:Transcript_9506/g.9324  ORF Transcript_9506/g.9324 Transcript_9506/m.9324 type:complete len:211 (-) Transcript_9506:469-1101(-)
MPLPSNNLVTLCICILHIFLTDSISRGWNIITSSILFINSGEKYLFTNSTVNSLIISSLFSLNSFFFSSYFSITELFIPLLRSFSSSVSGTALFELVLLLLELIVLISRISFCPKLEVIIMTVFLKSTTRPCESVNLPSSKTCNNKLLIDLCDFSNSSKSMREYGFLIMASVRNPPFSYPTYPGGEPINLEMECASMYSLISTVNMQEGS